MHQKAVPIWLLPLLLPRPRHPLPRLLLLPQSNIVHPLPLPSLFPITLFPLPHITRHPIPPHLRTIMPLSTFPTSIFPEIFHLPPNSLLLVQTSQMPSLALLRRPHNWLSSSARLFLRYAMPP